MDITDPDDYIPPSQYIEPNLFEAREMAANIFDDSEEEILLNISQKLDPDIIEKSVKTDLTEQKPEIILEKSQYLNKSFLEQFQDTTQGSSFEMDPTSLLPLEDDIPEKGHDVEGDRFGPGVSDKDMEEFSKTATPANTLKRNNWAISIYNAWARSRNSSPPVAEDKFSKVNHLLDSSVEELAYWFSKFVLEVKKQNGDFYPPKTIMHIMMGIQSYIRLEKKWQINVLNSPDFEGFRQIFDAELKRLAKEGIGSKVKQAEVVTVSEEETFWQKKLLGDMNAKVLLRTLVVLNGKNFALRSGREHRNLRFRNSQIELVEPVGGRHFLRYTEDISKNRQGGLKHLNLQKKVVLQHANIENPARCHVELYKKYMQFSPKEGRDNAFYLTPLQKPKQGLWYSILPVGINTLSKVTSDLYKEAGLGGFHTNHSWRATTATRLYEKGVDEQRIMERTGHLSVGGVRSYKRTTDEQKLELSDILNSGEPAAKKVCGESSSSSGSASSAASHGTININLQNCSVQFGHF